MNWLKRIIRNNSWKRLLRFSLYPFTLLVLSPVRYLQAVRSARIFIHGRWSSYLGCDVLKSFTRLYYWNDAVNIDRFGRGGISRYKGLGDADLGKLFKYSLPSLYAYRCMGAMLPLVCMLGWWGSHFLWLDDTNAWWVGVVVLAGLFSTTSFAATFINQNYNVLGWLFFPMGLWGLQTGNYWIAALAWFLASMGSITVVAIACMFSLAVAIKVQSTIPVLATLPAVLKVMGQFYWSINSGSGMLHSMVLRAKAIGVSDSGVKYKRVASKRFTEKFYYFLFIYIIFGFFLWYVNEQMPVLWITAIVINLVNTRFVRFADDQSMYMMMLGLSSALMLQSQNPFLLIPYWLVVSPIPFYIGIAEGNNYDVPLKCEPYNLSPAVERVEQFFAPVYKDKRILMAFDDPKNIYENIFDGYRALYELPLYVATLNYIHLFPDWWAVFDTNYEGAPEFWGRSVEAVSENIRKWQCDYVIVYQESGTELDQKWKDAGFSIEQVLDWGLCETILRGATPWKGEVPKWWLLNIPANK